MKFKNNTNDKIRIRLDEPKQTSGYKWVWLKKGQTIDISKHYGEALKLESAEELATNEQIKIMKKLGLYAGKGMQTKAEAEKLISDKQNKLKTEKEPEQVPEEVAVAYVDKLRSIDGVGEKTAKDIIKVFPTEELLKKAIESGEDIPIRDDIAALVKDKFE